MPGPQVKDWSIYHALRAQGKSKSLSARIANSKRKKKRKKKKGS